MACVLCRYELPNDQTTLDEYGSWITGDGLRRLLSLKGLKEFRAYRDYGGAGLRITGILLFSDLRSALGAASSDIWKDLMANLTRWGCQGVELSVLEPSPLLPQPIYPK